MAIQNGIPPAVVASSEPEWSDCRGNYALAFALLASLQTGITVLFAVTVCDLEIQGSVWLLLALAVINSILGTALGLMVSAFARTEFQVVQFLPVFVFPQIILGGVFMPRERMPEVLEVISEFMPLSHAIDGVSQVAAGSTGWDIGRPALLMAGFALICLTLAALTLPRRTP
jgi:ABC transporter DrrB family efflux protein